MGFKDTAKINATCVQYCTYFKVNSISKALEGDLEFLNKIISTFKRFITENEKYKPISLSDKGRLLSTDP